MADHVDRHDLQRAAAERRAEHREAEHAVGGADAETRRRGAEQRRLAALTGAREPTLATLWQEQRHDARVAANIVKLAEARRAAAWPQRRHGERSAAVVVRDPAAWDARAEALRELAQLRRRPAQRTDHDLDDRKQRRK